MKSKELKEKLKSFCNELNLSYPDLVKLENCLESLKKEVLTGEITKEINWKPLRWYNPKNDTEYDYSEFYEFAFLEKSNTYIIKSVNTRKKFIYSREGQYGLYWNFSIKGKTYYVAEFQLEYSYFRYSNRNEYEDYIFSDEDIFLEDEEKEEEVLTLDDYSYEDLKFLEDAGYKVRY